MVVVQSPQHPADMSIGKECWPVGNDIDVTKFSLHIIDEIPHIFANKDATPYGWPLDFTGGFSPILEQKSVNNVK
jgi:hypothetical protein